MFLLIPLAGFLAWILERKLAKLQHTSNRIARDLREIRAHLGIAENGPDLTRVRTLASEGKLIQAIKVHRDLTGDSLAESKRAVEAIAGVRPEARN